MSPEQVQAGPVDARSDLFGLGVVLYQMATGQLPFQGNNLYCLAAAIVEHQPPPPARLNPAVPAELSRLILRLLAKSPADRPASARAVADALAALERRPGRPPGEGEARARSGPDRGRARRWRLAAAAAALAAVLFGVAGYLALAPRAGRPAAPEQGAAAEPLRGDIDVRIWEAGNPQRQGLKLSHPQALPLRAGDLMRIEVDMKRPAYLYVVWLEAGGAAVPVYPWRGGDWKRLPAEQAPRRRFSLPPEEGAGNPLSEGSSGVEALVLLAREEPLADGDLSGRFVGWRPQDAPGLRAALWLENGEEVWHERERGSIKVGDPRKIDDPLMRLKALLMGELKALFPYTRAVCFSFQGQ
jgi:hypothetical protein